MKVAELKKELDKFDDNLEVITNWYGTVPLAVNNAKIINGLKNDDVKTQYLFLDNNKKTEAILKLYLCTPETCGWDEFDGFVVLAKNKSEALELVTDIHTECFEHQGYITIEEVDMNKKGIILGSFNAG